MGVQWSKQPPGADTVYKSLFVCVLLINSRHSVAVKSLVGGGGQWGGGRLSLCGLRRVSEGFSGLVWSLD